MLRPFAILVCTVLLVAGAVACSDDDSATKAGSVPTSTGDFGDSGSPSGSSESTTPADDGFVTPTDGVYQKPTLPADATGPGRRSARKFTYYFIDVMNYTASTGDTSLLRKVSSSNCDGCNAYVDFYSKLYRKGGYIRHHRWRITDIYVVREGQLGLTASLCTVKASRNHFSNSAKDEDKIGRGGTYQPRFEFKHHHDGWEVVTFGVQGDLSDH